MQCTKHTPEAVILTCHTTVTKQPAS